MIVYYHITYHSKKRLVYDFKWLFCSYCSFTKFQHIFLYTKIVRFSHCHDFHKPSVYQNSHIPTTYQYFSLIPSCIPEWEKFNCVFSMWIVIFLEILLIFLVYLSSYTVNVVIDTQSMWMEVGKKVLSKTQIYMIYMVIKQLFIHTEYLQNFVGGVAWTKNTVIKLQDHLPKPHHHFMA